MEKLLKIVRFYYEKHLEDPEVYIEGAILNEMEKVLENPELLQEEKDFLLESMRRYFDTINQRSIMIQQLEEHKDELVRKNEAIEKELALERQLKFRKQESLGRVSGLIIICSFVMVIGPLVLYAQHTVIEKLLDTFKDLALIVLGAFLSIILRYAGVEETHNNKTV